MCPGPPPGGRSGFLVLAETSVYPHVPAGGRVLQIPLVRAEDAGRYSCRASNEAGEDWLHYELLVLSEWPSLGAGGGERAQV